MTIYYFGTSLTEHGHYYFEIVDNSMAYCGLRSPIIPFEPESLTRNLKRGQSALYQITSPIGDFTVWAIYGSPKDERGGVKSVFWVKAKDADIIQIVKQNPKAKQILDAIK